MSSEWRTVEIASLCEGIFDGPHATPKKTAQGPIFLGISSLERGRLNLTNTEHLSEDDFSKWTKRVVPREGDIVFSYETRLGEVAIIPADLRCCLGRRMALMRIDRTKALPEYVLYAYMAPAFQAVIKTRTVHGSTVDRIPLTEFGSFPISVPSLRTQREITEILGALDDRITLLRETNKTLEAIAQTIFKSWFVDYEPVRSKMEGRQPEGMDEETAALFSDSLEESELGLVPNGWHWGSLDDLSTLNPESWTAKKHPEILKYVDLSNTKENIISGASMLSFEAAPSRARRVLRKGDSIVGTVRPGNKSYAFITSDFENLTGSTGFAVLRPKNLELAEFIYISATRESVIEHLTHIADGGAYPAIRPEAVAKVRVVIPSDKALEKFHQIVSPLFESIANNQSRMEVLTSMRDTLLPRLISGQIRLPEAQERAENALS